MLMLRQPISHRKRMFYSISSSYWQATFGIVYWVT